MNRRQFIGGATAAAVTACASLRQRLRYDAVVGVTSATDAPRYESIAAAIQAAPERAGQRFRILLGPGRFSEKLIIDKPGIRLVGSGLPSSVISFAAAAGQVGPDGAPWGTWRCATLTVRAADFCAHHLTVENAFDYVGNLRQPRFEAIGPNGAQAVALMLDRGSDRAQFSDCEIRGHQDTLFADAGRSRFTRCRISGSVDFVFGAGQAQFLRCELVSRYRPGKDIQGCVAAPSTSIRQAQGLLFERCRLLKEPEIAVASVRLGRAWRPSREFGDGRYGDPDAVGAAAFLDCWMDDHIATPAWDAMAYTARDGQRVLLPPAAARLSESGSRGPGALRSGGGRPARAG